MTAAASGKKRIALILIVAGMIFGLFCPAACDDIYDALHGINRSSQVIRAIDSASAHDCILESSAAVQELPVLSAKKGTFGELSIVRPGLSFLYGPAGISCLITGCGIFYLLALIECTGLSEFHILFIHLKDGHK